MTIPQTRLRCADAAPGPVGVVGIITCERPGVLDRNLTGQLDNRHGHGRDHEIVVVDDSRDPRGQDDCQRLLRIASARYRMHLRYSGAPGKRAYAGELAGECRRAGVDPALIEFALFDPHGVGWTGGANRNALPLDTV